jgi:hypothetical protein
MDARYLLYQAPVRGESAMSHADALKHDERRGARRREINRVAKIRLTNDTPPRDCLITDISASGVRLHVEAFDVPEDFVLVFSDDDLAKECSYRVVWRVGHEIGARFVGLVRRSEVGGCA